MIDDKVMHACSSEAGQPHGAVVQESAEMPADNVIPVLGSEKNRSTAGLDYPLAEAVRKGSDLLPIAADPCLPHQPSKLSSKENAPMATHSSDAQANAPAANRKKIAKAAYEKGSARLGEFRGRAKRNVDAVVETGKILNGGLRGLGNNYVAEGRAALQTVAADLQDFAAVKSPASLFALQTRIMRRNLAAMLDFNAKNAEAFVNLAKSSAAPISKRVNLAIEDIRGDKP